MRCDFVFFSLHEMNFWPLVVWVWTNIIINCIKLIFRFVITCAWYLFIYLFVLIYLFILGKLHKGYSNYFKKLYELIFLFFLHMYVICSRLLLLHSFYFNSLFINWICFSYWFLCRFFIHSSSLLLFFIYYSYCLGIVCLIGHG